jgi:hypothetical protein
LRLQPNALDELIQKIGAEIYRRGSCLLSEEELVLICQGAVDEANRRACICEIAAQYRWAFEFSDGMKSVRLRDLLATNSQT